MAKGKAPRRALAKKGPSASRGRRITELRKKRGFSKTGLAEAVGLTYRSILRLENGEVSSPRGDNLRAIAAVLGVTTDHLLGDEVAA